VAGFGLALVGGSGNERLTKRAQGIARDVRQGSAAAAGGRTPPTPSQRRRQLLQNLREADRVQRKATLSLSAKISQAGLSISPRLFWTFSGAAALACAVVAMILKAPPLLALGVGVVAGLGLPRMVLSSLSQKRTKKFTAEFPNAMDIITRGIKSGLPVHDCLKIIGKESPEPLAEEFRRIIEQIGMGVTVEQALERAYERMPTPELRFFTIVLAIQQKTAETWPRRWATCRTVLRSRKMMREKIKALSAEATASAMIIGACRPACWRS
jgi:tight adherence protein B